MAEQLNAKKIAILAIDGFEQVELTEPNKVKVNKTLDQANPNDYDVLVLPGGVMNPDHLRMDPKAVRFVKEFVQSGKPVAAICHGPWTLIEAGVVKGKTMTSWPSIKTDLKNAGANRVDEQVVEDGDIITSRKPEDIPAFSQKIIEKLADKKHQLRAAS